MLALLLIMGFPFYDKKIDLIGFSLGCQVIKSCLRTLSQYNANHIIQDVYMIAGATSIGEEDIDILPVISGTLKTTYSKLDIAMKVYKITQGKHPIGS